MSFLKARKKAVTAITLAGVLLSGGMAFAKNSVLDDRILASDADFLTKMTDRVCGYTKDLFTRIGKTDTYIETQWALDDANIDLVWEAFDTQLKAPAEPVYLVVYDEMLNVKNSDWDNTNLYRVKDNVVSGDETTAHGILGQNPNWAVDFKDTMKRWMGATKSNTGVNTIDTSNKYGGVYHGSHVSGIAAAKHDTKGIAGIAPNVKVIPIYMWGTTYTGLCDYISDDLIPQIKTETGKSKVRIIVNISNGSIGNISSEHDNKVYASMKALSDKGVIFVSASHNVYNDLKNGFFGKDNSKRIIPGTSAISADNFINAASHTSKRELQPGGCGYSTSGESAIVHISAPGVNILSTGGKTSDGTNENEWYIGTGTSMASPMVAGSAALLWNIFPDATANQIVKLIEAGARASANQKITPFGGQASNEIKGYVRWGFLDVAKSVKESKSILGDAMGKEMTIPVKKIVISAPTDTLIAGQTTTVTANTIYPYTADNKNYTWKSENTSLLTVDSNGKVTVNGTVDADTTVNVYAKAADAKGTESNKITFAVKATPKELTSVTISKDITESSVESGRAITYEAVLNPSDAVCKSIKWTVTGKNGVVSSDVVTASKEGVKLILTAKSAGTVDILLTCIDGAGNEKTDTISLTVKQALSEIVIAEGSTGNLKVGENMTLNVMGNPTGAHDYNVAKLNWKVISGDANITLTPSGTKATVTGVKEGKAEIQVSHETFTANYTVTITKETPVPDPETPPTPDPETPPVTPPSTGSEGGGGGCNTGFAGIALLAIAGLSLIKRKK